MVKQKIKLLLYKAPKQFLYWCAEAYYLQLIMTLASLPLLVWWGLPFSVLSILGNLIFSPFLAIFLAVSSLLFFTELCGIKNEFLAFALDKITNIWNFFLAWGNDAHLIGAVPPHGAVLCVITFLILIFIAVTARQSLQKRCIQATCMSIIMFVFFKTVQNNTSPIREVTTDFGTMTVAHTENKIMCIDTGGLSTRVMKAKSLEYNLRPTFIKATGCTEIGCLILLQPTEQALKNTRYMLDHYKIDTIFVPFISKTVPSTWNRAYRSLGYKAEEKGAKLSRFSTTKARKLYEGKNCLIELVINTSTNKPNVHIMCNQEDSIIPYEDVITLNARQKDF